MSNINQQQHQYQMPLLAPSSMSSTSSSSTSTTMSINLQTSFEYNHQTFQDWLDILVDPNSNEDTKNKTITEIGLHLEVK